MALVTERQAMQHALTLSALRIGATAPNPPVGCVILSPAGEVLGSGHHVRKGESHAEVNALSVAGERARGATAVVTLEPCNHVGRTPACHQALIDAGISRVVVALVDPTSRGEGGISRLRQAGVGVEVGVCEREATLVLGPWLRSLELGRPVLSWAITNPPYDATARDLVRAWAAPAVDAVVDEHGRVSEAVPGAHHPDELRLPDQPLPADPGEALTVLRRSGARRVLLLGGPHQPAQSLFASVDELVVFTRDAGVPSRTASDEALVPDGWGIAELRPVPGGVVATYLPMTRPSDAC